MQPNGKYREFLEMLANVDLPIEDYCHDMKIPRKDIHQYMKLAKLDGITIIKTKQGRRIEKIRVSLAGLEHIRKLVGDVLGTI